MLSGISGNERPTDPTAFPRCVTSNLTMSQSIRSAEEANRERFRLARVPREWAVAVMPINRDDFLDQLRSSLANSCGVAEPVAMN